MDALALALDEQRASGKAQLGLLLCHGEAVVPCPRVGTTACRRGCRANPWSVRAGEETSGMAMNFLACDREQAFLMPLDPRDWLPEGHLAWFVLESVEQMDLASFYGSYRVDGWGRAAFEPSMMVSLLLYAYARGERSSRGIERRCVEDVAYRV